MRYSVFVEVRFWVLVFVSVGVPITMILVERRRQETRRSFALVFGLALTTISGLDVYLLQALASASRATPSLLDDKIFSSGISFALYVFPIVYGGIGVNIIASVLLAHLRSTEAHHEAPHASATLSSRSGRTLPGTQRQLRTFPGEPCVMPDAIVLRPEVAGAIRNKIDALLQQLQSGPGGMGVPFDELFSPEFMNGRASFGIAGDVLEAAGSRKMVQEDRGRIASTSWNAFVPSAVQFTAWDRTLESACRHWLANQLLSDRPDR